MIFVHAHWPASSKQNTAQQHTHRVCPSIWEHQPISIPERRQQRSLVHNITVSVTVAPQPAVQQAAVLLGRRGWQQRAAQHRVAGLQPIDSNLQHDRTHTNQAGEARHAQQQRSFAAAVHAGAGLVSDSTAGAKPGLTTTSQSGNNSWPTAVARCDGTSSGFCHKLSSVLHGAVSVQLQLDHNTQHLTPKAGI